MDKNIAIKADNIYKSFRIPHERNRSFKSTALNIFKKKTYTKFDAAKGISFEVKKGEFYGIIGRNGSGKSTMLKMLAGIYSPDRGKVLVNGRISPFLELGVGFNYELTGRENVYLNGTILGLSRKEINKKFDDIIGFAELADFVDQKLKNYSSGMQVRLAFSVAIHAHAEILLMDEVLAVGDSNFQKKCFDVFKEYKKRGRTIIFVSHAMESIKEFCDRVLVIDQGKVVFMGAPEVAIKKYNEINAMENKQYKVSELIDQSEAPKSYHIGSKNAVFEKVSVLNKDHKECESFAEGDDIIVTFKYNITKKINELYFGFSIYPENRQESVFGFDYLLDKNRDVLALRISKHQLAPGTYFISLGLTNRPNNWMSPYDLMEKAIKIRIISSSKKNKLKNLNNYSIINAPFEVTYVD